LQFDEMEQNQNQFLSLLRSDRTRPVIIAHRGNSFHAPENTLEAARLGWEAGADAWELDVQLTRDGVPVVLHDSSLLRTTDVAARFANDPRAALGFRIADFDWDEVRSLDAGSWFVGSDVYRSARAFGTLDQIPAEWLACYRSGQVRVPTLEQALALTRDLGWLVNVEVKWSGRGTVNVVKAVLDQIAATVTAARVMISSFDHSAVAAANTAGRHYSLGILAASPLYRAADYALDLVGADAVNVSTEVMGIERSSEVGVHADAALNAELVDEVKRRDVPILVYTVNDHRNGGIADLLVGLGVDGLFTDDPRAMARRFGVARRAGRSDSANHQF
jgi:glycerophosphoryl diester phosphodiesterase